MLVSLRGPSNTLVVSADTVFTAPPIPSSLDVARGEIRIPALALERASGVSFLRNLNLDLPPRVRERVQVIPFQLKISCELAESPYNGASEYCHVMISAVSADNAIVETWTGTEWMSERTARPRAIASAGKDQEPHRLV